MPSSPDAIDQALTWLAAGRSVALATVVDTWGSAPRRPGSHMAIDGEGRFAGSVSGGCVEVAVVAEAGVALERAEPRLVTYGVADADAWAVGLACGGSIQVLVTPVGQGEGEIAPELLERIAGVGPGHEGEVVAFDLAGSSVEAVSVRTGLPAGERERVLRSGEASTVDVGERRLFLRPYLAPPRIVVIGAVHIAQPLVAYAEVLGFEVVVIDPRSAFANADRFPGVTCLDLWPEEGLRAAAVDPRTAIVALTHDPKLDDPALRMALEGPAFYVGALGSRRTHARRLDRLREAGVTDDRLARIHAPIGLDLGGRSPEEIALSIVSEIVAVLRGGGAVHAR